MTNNMPHKMTQWCTLAALSLAALISGPAAAAGGQWLPVDSVLLRLIEQVEVPAREAGMLADVQVQEGQLVEPGEELGRLEDAEARLAQEKAQIELDIARQNAANDTSIRYAQKSLQVAESELQRARSSVAKFPRSVSQSELDRLQLVAERSALEIEQAEHEQQIARSTERLKENELALAVQALERRMIRASIRGVVVEVERRQGEWVEPGDKIFRILRVDRLRAEGFLPAQAVRNDLEGRPVNLTVNLPGKGPVEFPGKLTFVSPEIDAVNEQVRVLAEIENRGLQLRPGLRAKMAIATTP